jgi:hypothetical protein
MTSLLQLYTILGDMLSRPATTTDTAAAYITSDL